MTKSTSTLRISICALIALAATGCATTNPTTSAPEAAHVAPESYTYQVKPGDRLSDIALSITGNIADWKSIASFNGIDDPRSLAAGDTLVIPNDLLPESLSHKAKTHDSVAQVAANTRSPLSVPTGNSVSVARTTKVSNEQIAVFPVSVNRSFNLQPIVKRSDKQGISASNSQYDSLPPTVTVLGTYYPIGVYAEPANYSQLVKRVAPGTQFQLHSEVNDWYKIVTEDGYGYIRQSDSVFEQ